MQASIYTIKRKARIALTGAMGTAILGVVAEFGVSMGGAYLAGSLFAGTDILSLIMYQVFAFLVSLITSVVSAGLSYLYLNIYRKKAYAPGNLLFFFKNHPDRVIVASFVLAVIQLLSMIPYYYYQFTAVVEQTLEAQSSYLMTTMVLMLGGQVLYLIISVPFALTYYLMADDHDLGGIDALKKSMEMMKGAKAKYLLMLLSFAPVMILSAFLFYLPLIWVVPHLLMCEAAFYELRLHPETDLPDQRWPRQTPTAYMNPYLGKDLEDEGESMTAGPASWERAAWQQGPEDVPLGQPETVPKAPEESAPSQEGAPSAEPSFQSELAPVAEAGNGAEAAVLEGKPEERRESEEQKNEARKDATPEEGPKAPGEKAGEDSLAKIEEEIRKERQKQAEASEEDLVMPWDVFREEQERSARKESGEDDQA